MRVDTLKPGHCSDVPNACHDMPLTVSARITKTPSITLTFSGWSDRTGPGLTADSVSGIKEFHIEAYEMTSLGKVLGVSGTRHVYEKVPAEDSSKVISLPQDQLLYSIILTATDKAGNFFEARRLVLYDSSSELKVDTNKKLWSPTGTAETAYLWQTIIGDVSFSWKGLFYNSLQQKHNLLKSVRPDTSRFDGEREQTSGPLSIAGTPNVDGIVSFQYSTTKSRSSILSKPLNTFDYTEVPDFLNEEITLISPNIVDGDRIFFLLKAGELLVKTFVCI